MPEPGNGGGKGGSSTEKSGEKGGSTSVFPKRTSEKMFTYDYLTKGYKEIPDGKEVSISVKGTPLDAVIHLSNNSAIGKYVVTEQYTGKKVGEGNSRKAAIQNAQARIDKNSQGMSAKDFFNRFMSGGDMSPRYNNERALIW